MDAKNLAYQDYMDGMKYKDIAEKYGVSINTVKSWQKRNGWNRKAGKGAPKKKGVGAPKGNQNAKGNSGGSAPKGNRNAVSHGAYQSIYTKYLPEAEREAYEEMSDDTSLESEIKLVRFKLARILNNPNLDDETANKGILACTAQLERLVRIQAQLQRTALDDEEQKERIKKLRAETKRIGEEKQDKAPRIEVVMAKEVSEYAE